MNNELKKCPYCLRKINYGRRFLEKSKGEHTCSHCKKISNIKQNSLIWISFIIACMLALIIMVFYLSSAKSIQKTYDTTGKMKFFVNLFFGSMKEVKWVIWETLPFIVFYFISPLFIEFYPQKRFMSETQTNIDLSIPLSSMTSTEKLKAENRTRNIPKIKEPEFSGIYEDISSSSSGDIEKTRAFNVMDAVDVNVNKNNMTDISYKSNSKSQSYSSDVPLIKVNREPLYQEDEEVKEYIPAKERTQDIKIPVQKEKPAGTGNYSANRKF